MSSAPSSDSSGAGTRAWRSLGARLALWYVATMALSFVALAAIVPITVHAWVDREGQRSTESMLGKYRGALELGGTDALRAMFDCAGAPPSSVALQLRDERDVEIYSASSDDASNRVAASLRETRAEHLAPAPTPEGWHIAATSVSQGRELEIVLHDDSADQVWAHAREASLLILACGLVFTIAGAFLITRRALRPIGDLARATQAVISSGDLKSRVKQRGTGDDLDDLAELFNRMLARNETLVRAMKESLDNVAHDLRTPLTRLRAGAELALRDAESAPHAREAFAETIEETDRVLAMLTTLMDITGAETGAMHLDKHDEVLAAIAREAIDLYDFVSSERGVRIVTRLAPNIFVIADRARIKQVCANLIDNAIKYTKAGGQVEVTVLEDDTFGILSVADTGIGIASADRERVFERLYRADQSRTEHGLGLGLSLVKAVVEAHGGEIRLRSEVGVGSTFEVRLRRPDRRHD